MRTYKIKDDIVVSFQKVDKTNSMMIRLVDSANLYTIAKDDIVMELFIDNSKYVCNRVVQNFTMRLENYESR